MITCKSNGLTYQEGELACQEDGYMYVCSSPGEWHKTGIKCPGLEPPPHGGEPDDTTNSLQTINAKDSRHNAKH